MKLFLVEVVLNQLLSTEELQLLLKLNYMQANTLPTRNMGITVLQVIQLENTQ